MTRPYRPSNGTEGMDFMEKFCERCEKDFLYRKTDDGRDGCAIASAALLYGLEDPEYPKEWVIEDDDLTEPRCTAFEEELTEEARFHRAAEAAGQKRLF